MVFSMPLMHRNTEFFQALRNRVVRQVRTAHLKAQIEQHLGDTAHASAAYANEVDMFDLVSHAAANSAHTCATRCAAAGCATARAACAISSARALLMLCSNSARCRGVNSVCGSRIAAPRSLRKRALPVW